MNQKGETTVTLKQEFINLFKTAIPSMILIFILVMIMGGWAANNLSWKFFWVTLFGSIPGGLLFVIAAMANAVAPD